MPSGAFRHGAKRVTNGSPRIVGEALSEKCDNDRVAKNPTRLVLSRTTEWSLGQPLVFPPKLNGSEFERLAREAVEEVRSGPFKRKRQKHKKKILSSGVSSIPTFNT